jgi:hypothetical protein
MENDLKQKRTLLGEMLLARGLITTTQLEAALTEQKKAGGFIGTILVTLGFLSDEELMPVLSEQLGIKHVKLGNIQNGAGKICLPL